jgi:hypothetical protein
MTVNANSCQENFFHSKEYQIMHYGRAYDDCRVGLEEAIEIDPKTFFGYVDLKKKRVGYPSVMHFEGRLASGPDDIYNHFVVLYNEHKICMMYGCLLIPDQISCRMTCLLVLFSSL